MTENDLADEPESQRLRHLQERVIRTSSSKELAPLPGLRIQWPPPPRQFSVVVRTVRHFSPESQSSNAYLQNRFRQSSTRKGSGRPKSSERWVPFGCRHRMRWHARP